MWPSREPRPTNWRAPVPCCCRTAAAGHRHGERARPSAGAGRTGAGYLLLSCSLDPAGMPALVKQVWRRPPRPGDPGDGRATRSNRAGDGGGGARHLAQAAGRRRCRGHDPASVRERTDAAAARWTRWPQRKVQAAKRPRDGRVQPEGRRGLHLAGLQPGHRPAQRDRQVAWRWWTTACNSAAWARCSTCNRSTPWPSWRRGRGRSTAR